MNNVLHINDNKLLKFGGFIQEEVEKQIIDDKRDEYKILLSDCEVNVDDIERYISVTDPDFAKIVQVAGCYDHIRHFSPFVTEELQKYVEDGFYDWVLREIVRLVKERKAESAMMTKLKSSDNGMKHISDRLTILNEHILYQACTLFADRVASHEEVEALTEYKDMKEYVEIILCHIEYYLQRYDLEYEEIKSFIKKDKKRKKS